MLNVSALEKQTNLLVGIVDMLKKQVYFNNVVLRTTLLEEAKKVLVTIETELNQ